MPTLPNGFMPVVSGYHIDEPGGVMRTEVAGGSPRYAMEWDRGLQRYQVTLILDAAGFSAWTLFYHWQIGKGSVAFNMPLDSGFGVAPHLVNIVPGSYTATRTEGVLVIVSFTAETENQVYQMTAADAQALLDFYNQYGSGSSATLARIAQFANQDTLVLQ